LLRFLGVRVSSRHSKIPYLVDKLQCRKGYAALPSTTPKRLLHPGRSMELSRSQNRIGSVSMRLSFAVAIQQMICEASNSEVGRDVASLRCPANGVGSAIEVQFRLRDALSISSSKMMGLAN
jgi:hypothetical protein